MKMNITKRTDSAAAADMFFTLSTEIRSDLPSLKRGQDQLFQKQDEILCTLSGETSPVINTPGFHSPSGCNT